MNLLFGVCVIILLLAGEFGQQAPVPDPRAKLLAILFTLVAIPGVALAQHCWLTRKHASYSFLETEIVIDRMLRFHSGLWFLSSLVVILCFRWNDILRENWKLNQWPIVDEVFLLLPTLGALLLSSLIQTRTRMYIESQPQENRSSVDSLAWKKTLRIAVFRFRYMAGIVLIPAFLVFLLRDTVALKLQGWWITGLFLGVLGLLVIYPRIVLRIWPTRKIPDSDFEEKADRLAQNLQLGIKIRLLETQDQFLTAMVLGLFPGTRILLISDAMWNRFTQAELLAVIRHEAAHITQRHFAKRLGLFFAPLTLCVLLWIFANASNANASNANAWNLMPLFTANLLALDLSTQWGSIAVFFSYLVYILSIVRPAIVRMELEADKASIELESSPEKNRLDLIAALQRMAAYSPDYFNSRSISHPSYQERLDQLLRLCQ